MPLGERWEGETLEDQFRDLCEIVPEFQDIAYQQLYDTQSTAWSPLATQLRCYYRSVQLAKESFDGAQALL